LIVSENDRQRDVCDHLHSLLIKKLYLDDLVNFIFERVFIYWRLPG